VTFARDRLNVIDVELGDHFSGFSELLLGHSVLAFLFAYLLYSRTKASQNAVSQLPTLIQFKGYRSDVVGVEVDGALNVTLNADAYEKVTVPGFEPRKDRLSRHGDNLHPHWSFIAILLDVLVLQLLDGCGDH
jgi:hypothetical protein